MVCVREGTCHDFSVTSTEPVAEPQASSLPKTLPGPSCLRESLGIYLPSPPLGQLQQELVVGGPESPSDLPGALRLPLPLSPRLAENCQILFFSRATWEGRELLGT